MMLIKTRQKGLGRIYSDKTKTAWGQSGWLIFDAPKLGDGLNLYHPNLFFSSPFFSSLIRFLPPLFTFYTHLQQVLSIAIKDLFGISHYPIPLQ
jgi:hypothetical protein